MEKAVIKRYVNLFLKIAVTVTALFFVFSKISIREVVDLFSSSGISWLFLALLLFMVSKTIAAFRLNHFFRRTGIVISSLHNLKLYILGMFYNLFLPGGIGGDGYKIYLLNRHTGVKAGRIFWAVLLDRVVGILALFCLLVIMFYLTPLAGGWEWYAWTLIPLAVFSFYFFTAMLLPHFRSIVFTTIYFSLFVQLAQMACAVLILHSFGVRDQYVEYLFVFLISSIVAALPVSIGGLGARELTFLYGSELMGLDMDTSVALSLMFYIITAIVSLTGAYFSIRTDKIK